MYCQKCGTALQDGAAFCTSCGASVGGLPPKQSVPQSQPESYQQPLANHNASSEEIIDLSGVANLDVPHASAHKGTVCASLLMIVAWIAFILLFPSLRLNIAESDMSINVLLSTALIYVPLGVIGLLLTNNAKKSAGQMRTPRKGSSIALIIFATICSTLVPAIAFTPDTHAASDLINIVSWISFGVFALFFFIIARIFAGENGKEGMFLLLKAFFIALFPAVILSFLWIKLLETMFAAIAVIIAAVVLFFVCGGRVIFVRTTN